MESMGKSGGMAPVAVGCYPVAEAWHHGEGWAASPHARREGGKKDKRRYFHKQRLSTHRKKMIENILLEISNQKLETS